MKTPVYATLAATALLLASCAEPPKPPRPVPVKPPTEVNGLWYLDQGWSQEARQWYYTTTQGSQIMRYDMPDAYVLNGLAIARWEQDGMQGNLG